jgi:hypothetical protein
VKCAVRHRQQEAVRTEAINQTIHVLLVAFATYLGDKRGWKPGRICEALRWINKFAEMINEDYLTLAEAESSLLEDYGLRIYNSKIERK